MKLREFGKFKEFDSKKIHGFRRYIEESWNRRYCLYDDSALYENSYLNKQQFLILMEIKLKLEIMWVLFHMKVKV